MTVLCITWPLNLIKCHCHESKYVYEGRNACRSGRISSVCFNLERRARSVTYFLTSQTDRGEWRMRRVFTINRSTTKMPRKCAAVGCAELQTKGSLFSFHTFPKDSTRRKLHPWRFILEIVPSRLSCGHPHRHDFFTKVYRSRIARLSLGWSLVDGKNGLFGWNLRPCQFYKEYIETDQRTQKYFLTPWHRVQRFKLKKEKNLFHKKPSRKKEREINKRSKCTYKSSARMNS